jgi:hypothetical protein
MHRVVEPSRFVLRDLGRLALKGISRPIRIHEARFSVEERDAI